MQTVFLKLFGEFKRVVELTFFTDAMNENHLQLLAIEVTLEVEDIDFKRQFRALLTTNSASALANNKQVSRCSSLGT